VIVTGRNRISEDALVSATLHLVGQSRAFVHQVESAMHEIGSLHDERAGRVVASMRLTLREPAGPGSVRHVEQAATELLRSLRAEDGHDAGRG
jgi:hypothetical protein